MGRRDQLKERAAIHTEKMTELYSGEIQRSISGTHIYGLDFQRKDTFGKSAVFSLEQSYTQDSVIRNSGEGKTAVITAVLNFASYRHAGGGFYNGAMAQEEAICHASFLYNVLREFPEYYEWNEAHYNRGLYMNRALYSKDVFFFAGQGGHVKADVITCAAPNRSVMFKGGRFSEKENEDALRERICFIRDICDHEDVGVLIAGAYGCGVFAQKPEIVARLFREAFSDTKVQKVIFAVPPDRNYEAFEREFG